MWITSSLTTALTPTAVALGNFDGVHLGHQQVIAPILPTAVTAQAQALTSSNLEQFSNPETSGPNLDPNLELIYPTVATFNPHPREFFSGQAWKLLTPPTEKAQQLSVLGVQQLALLPFNRELASLSPQEFVEKILVEQLQAQQVSVGEDFCFGHKRAGTATDLDAIASAYGITVHIVSLYKRQDQRISSSSIRQSLTEGDIDKANRFLGRPYTLIGIVEKGQQLGRTIGFPTANLHLPPDKFLPKLGVYCVEVSHGPESSNLDTNLSSHPGVMNIGMRPTVKGTSLTVEVHLFDWSGDLYGKTLTVSLKKFIRSEQKFSSLDDLKAQIQIDCEAARDFFRGI
ncbi:MAG: bifunctional riboflavin kinase/FAD synthetase [Moorea sp. SIO1G6]|uniref:bifunctional riboflavin kinase/FAD synthetase n=1 Tax=Moorena sp. SIO1G6 TaxID=2607840 RepID=UPI0013C08C1C|nr:bifunctional riboflavin kinase/FAD synthetase [Moorena sp. SIO1G6]NET63217.1 bifunctional riboflavin kinase/FAD synthetase [Moorena sp. SIO1G6]